MYIVQFRREVKQQQAQKYLDRVSEKAHTLLKKEQSVLEDDDVETTFHQADVNANPTAE